MTKDDSGTLDLVWGVEAIANIIGRTPRVTFHLCNTGELPARKVGGRWVIERSRLVAFFMEPAA
jgi:hypothetical protein